MIWTLTDWCKRTWRCTVFVCCCAACKFPCPFVSLVFLQYIK